LFSSFDALQLPIHTASSCYLRRLVCLAPQKTRPQPDVVRSLVLDWDQKSHAKQQQALTSLSLRTLAGILTLPDDGTPALRRLKVDAAKFTIANQIRLDETSLRISHAIDRTEEIVQLAEDLGLFKDSPLLDESEPPAPLRIAVDESADSPEPRNQIPAPPDSPAETPVLSQPGGPEESFVTSPLPGQLAEAAEVAVPARRQAWQTSSFWEPDANEPAYHSSRAGADRRYRR
jgi:hypothetical protein